MTGRTQEGISGILVILFWNVGCSDLTAYEHSLCENPERCSLMIRTPVACVLGFGCHVLAGHFLFFSRTKAEGGGPSWICKSCREGKKSKSCTVMRCILTLQLRGGIGHAHLLIMPRASHKAKSYVSGAERTITALGGSLY